MDKKHFLDLKIPLGIILTAYGLILSIYGLITPKDFYFKSANLNVNLIFGLLMLSLGLIFLLLSFLIRPRN
jgi:uncharacterized membrane protein